MRKVLLFLFIVLTTGLVYAEEINPKGEHLYFDDIFINSEKNHQIAQIRKNPGLLSRAELRKVLQSNFGEDSVLVGKRPIFFPDWFPEEKREVYSDILNVLRKEFPNPEESIEIYSVFPERIFEGPVQKITGIEVMNYSINTISMRGNLENGNRITFSVGYTRMVPLLTAERDIPKGTKLVPEYVSVRMVDIRKIKYEKPVNNIAGEDWYAKKLIPRGLPITENNIILPSDVNRGARVSIIIKKGSITMVLNGTAAEKGRIGDPIRVRPYRGSHELEGVLKNTREVWIEEF